MVLGSSLPWLQSILLEHGARNITTLDHRRITNAHPSIKTITFQDFNKMYMNGTFADEEKKFDAILSYYHLNNLGFGKFNQTLNPWADLIAMSKVWCVTKTGGRAMIGIPVEEEGVIFWNRGRVYDSIQMAHVFANWKHLHTEDNIDETRVDPAKTIDVHQTISSNIPLIYLEK